MIKFRFTKQKSIIHLPLDESKPTSCLSHSIIHSPYGEPKSIIYSPARQTLSKRSESKGFTIIELLVVIVVIGILAAITIVSYSAISSRVASETLKQDLNDGASRLKKYFYEYGAYPTSLDTNNCPTGTTNTIYCLKPSSGDSYTYNSASPYSTFSLTATKGSQSNYITQEGTQLSGPGPVLYLDAGISNSYPGYGTIWTDLSGKGNNGTLYSGVTYSSTNGGFLSFNGSATGYVNVVNSTSLNFGTGSFTIEAWIKFASYGGDYRTLISKGAGGGFSGWRFGLNIAGVPHILIGDTVGYNDSDLGSTAVGLNAWHYLTVVFDRTSNATAYVDGVNKGSSSIATKNGSVDNTSGIAIGNSYAYYNGQIGAVYIRNVALSASDINQNFNTLKGRYGL